MNPCLSEEIRLLVECERDGGPPAPPIIHQLIDWECQVLPDMLPPTPQWLTFQWPVSGAVNFEDYWRTRDRGRGNYWTGPYL